MNLRATMLLGAASLLAACSTAPQPQARSAKASQELGAALAGRTAGRPVSCIAHGAKMQIVDDWTILYRDRGTIYVQNPRGGCHGLSNSMSLVRNQFGTTRLCSGDINRIVDLRTGFGTGACTFSDFVPYRKLAER